MRHERRCKLRCGTGPSSKQDLVPDEAMQIEAQERVNQDPSNSHLPATAWPRQMCAAVYATQYRLVSLANRTVAVTTARPQRAQPSTGNSGQKYGRFLALSWNPSRYTGKGLRARTVLCPMLGHVRGYRSGCKVPTYESGVRGRDPPGEEITEQVISQGEGSRGPYS